MKLHDALKKTKGLPLAELEAGFDKTLDRMARDMTGHGPGHPSYDAIVNPPQRGHPRADEARESVLKAVRLPKPLVTALEKKAKSAHLSFNAAVREAVACWIGRKH